MNEQDKKIPLYTRLATARRAQKISQGALARQVNCAQAAVSMMENGRPDAMARETMLKIAEILKVEVDEPAETPATETTAVTIGNSVCPNGDCPSNVPFVVNGSVAFWPKKQPSPNAMFCAYCGEVLEHACSNCGAPINDGAFCQKCGAPHVMPPADEIADPQAWVAQRRKDIAEFKALI